MFWQSADSYWVRVTPYFLYTNKSPNTTDILYQVFVPSLVTNRKKYHCKLFQGYAHLIKIYIKYKLFAYIKYDLIIKY